MKKVTTVILAAGKGVRMKSKIPKVLQNVNGIPMIDRITDVVSPFSKKIIYVIGKKEIKSHLKKNKKSVFVFQRKKLGTAHAFLKTEKLFGRKKKKVLLLPGDVPLIDKNTIKKFIDFHIRGKNDISILTAKIKNPHGYGRIIKKKNMVCSIREELDANEREKKIKTINGGIYIFTLPKIFEILKKVKKNPLKGEYYLTDVIEIAYREGLKIKNFNLKNSQQIIGINTKKQLQELNRKLGRKL
jgi:bifunctional UDP-N-acetylglucosamine pyrophosphorylase/glucosamine-1-phosphate N-acetyltransferase